jgi:hypothetical protein
VPVGPNRKIGSPERSPGQASESSCRGARAPRVSLLRVSG